MKLNLNMDESMALHRDAASFAAELGSIAPLLALDAGEKTIGVASADGLWLAASPVLTIQRTLWREEVTALRKIIEDRGTRGFILGYPLNMNGTEGPRCQSVRALGRNLTQAFALPVLLWDERTSTQAVHRAMLEGDLSRQKRAERVDMLAAVFILQGAMDALQHLMQQKDQE